MNKRFFATLFFSSNDTPSEKMIFLENVNVLSDDKDIAKCMNYYFINITETLDIKKWYEGKSNIQNEGIVTKAISKY